LKNKINKKYLTYTIIFLFTVMSALFSLGWFVYTHIQEIDDQYILNHLKSETGLDISFENKQIIWKGLYPVIRINKITIIKSNNSNISAKKLSITNVDVYLNYFQILSQRRILIKKVVLYKPKLIIQDVSLIINKSMGAQSYLGILNLITSDILQVFQSTSVTSKIKIHSGSVFIEDNKKLIEIAKGINIKATKLTNMGKYRKSLVTVDINANFINLKKIPKITVFSNKLSLNKFNLSSKTRIALTNDNQIKAVSLNKLSDIDFYFKKSLVAIDSINFKMQWKIKDKSYLKIKDVEIIKDQNKAILDGLELSLSESKKAQSLLVKCSRCSISEMSANTNFPTHFSLQGGEIELDITKLALKNFEYRSNSKYNDKKEWNLNSSLSNLIINSKKLDMSFNVLDGVIDFSPNKMHLLLNNSKYTLPTSISNQSIKRHTANGALELIKGNNDWKLRVINFNSTNFGMRQKINGEITFDKKNKLFVDLKGVFRHKSIFRLLRDVDDKLIKLNLLKWLRESLSQEKQISGKYRIKGLLSDFPFKDKKGIFTVNAKLSDINFNYYEEWFPIEHANAVINVNKENMHITLQQGIMHGIMLKKATTTLLYLDDIDDVYVKILADSDLSQLLSYLYQSPIKEFVPDQINYKYKGKASVNLFLKIPLEDDEVELEGSVKVANGSVFQGFTENNLFDKFDGKIKILKGNIKKTSVDITRDFLLDISGKTNLHIKNHNEPSFIDYKGDLDIHYSYNNDDDWAWNFSSSLDLHKNGIQKLEDKLIDTLSQIVVLGNYTNEGLDIELFGKNKFTASCNIEKKKTDKSNLSDNKTAPQIRSVKVHLTEIDTLPYINYFNHIMSSIQFFNDSQVLKTSEIKLLVDELKFDNLKYKKVFLNILPNGKDYQITIDTDKIKGKINYIFKNSSWIVELEKLYLNGFSKLDGFSKNKPMFPIDVEDFINIDLKIKKMYLNDKLIGSVDSKIITENEKAEINGQKDAKTNFILHVQSNTFGNLLNIVGVDKKMNAKKATINMNLSWNSLIKKLHLEDLMGDVNLTIRDGQIYMKKNITQNNMFISKVLSLLNFNTIVRRLSLDFRDIFTNNVVFDKIESSFILDSGKCKSNDIQIHATNAKIQLNGEMDLSDSKFDFIATIMPSISSGLPIVATVAGGPFAGIAALFASGVVGKKINKIVKYKYKIKGDLDDFTVTKLT